MFIIGGSLLPRGSSLAESPPADFAGTASSDASALSIALSFPEDFEPVGSARGLLDTLEIRTKAWQPAFEGVEQFGIAEPRPQAGTESLTDPYTGEQLAATGSKKSDLVVDHVVSLKNAWQTGAQELTPERRALFATDPLNLATISAEVHRKKAGSDADQWMPTSPERECAYVARQVSIKAVYGLWVTARERAVFVETLERCPAQNAVQSSIAQSQPRPLPEPDPIPTTASDESTVVPAPSVRQQQAPSSKPDVPSAPAKPAAPPAPAKPAAPPAPAKPAAPPAPAKTAAPPAPAPAATKPAVPAVPSVPAVPPAPAPAPAPPAPPAPAPPKYEPVPPSGGTVRPGSFCTPAGATGYTVKGTPMVCGVAKGGRLRWISR
ncbi:HNH endonuclease family protein [Mycetocola tolaasinivorans]|uniref:HNH endonuclease family protein n=1 Tax=Mycetocola tolaasinivorans TaxID=76635 RepID=UPI003CCC59F6